jgi:hypothetical protein
MGEALVATAELSALPIDEFARQLERWFADWTAAGYFVAFGTPAEPVQIGTARSAGAASPR